MCANTSALTLPRTQANSQDDPDGAAANVDCTANMTNPRSKLLAFIQSTLLMLNHTPTLPCMQQMLVSSLMLHILPTALVAARRVILVRTEATDVLWRRHECYQCTGLGTLASQRGQPASSLLDTQSTPRWQPPYSCDENKRAVTLHLATYTGSAASADP